MSCRESLAWAVLRCASVEGLFQRRSSHYYFNSWSLSHGNRSGVRTWGSRMDQNLRNPVWDTPRNHSGDQDATFNIQEASLNATGMSESRRVDNNDDADENETAGSDSCGDSSSENVSEIESDDDSWPPTPEAPRSPRSTDNRLREDYGHNQEFREDHSGAAGQETSKHDEEADSEEDEELCCRICRQPATSDQNLCTPCKCSGSIKFVHQDCLLSWLKMSNRQNCEVCCFSDLKHFTEFLHSHVQFLCLASLYSIAFTHEATSLRYIPSTSALHFPLLIPLRQLSIHVIWHGIRALVVKTLWRSLCIYYICQSSPCCWDSSNVPAISPTKLTLNK